MVSAEATAHSKWPLAKWEQSEAVWWNGFREAAWKCRGQGLV